jgi:hypothetical protein
VDKRKKEVPKIAEVSFYFQEVSATKNIKKIRYK